MDQRSEQVEHTTKGHSLTWRRNVPFACVPVRIIWQFNGNRFTTEEFYKSNIWTFPEHWNSALYFDGEMVLFMYGTYDPLEKDVYVKRVAADPFAQVGYKSYMVQMILDELDRVGREKGAVCIWTQTHRKGFVRKLLGRGYIAKHKLIIENENF